MVWFNNIDYDLNLNIKTLILFSMTAFVSFVAWKYVEEPFRRNREIFSGRFVAAFLFCFAVFCISVGGYIYAKSGMENRFPNWVAVKKNLDAFDFKTATGTQISYPAGCEIGDDPQAILHKCAFGDLKSDNLFLVLGDSHAFAWYPAFQAAAETKHAQGVFVSLPGCPPLFGISSMDGAKNICTEGFDQRIGALIATKQIRKVFLVAFWSLYSEGDTNQPNHLISDLQTSSYDSAASKMVITRRLLDTIKRMNENGIEVVIVQSVPILPKPIQNLPVDFSQPLTLIQQQNKFMVDFVTQQSGKVKSIDPTGIFCHEMSCVTRINGNVLYTDNNHVSPAGAAQLIALIKSVL